MAGIIYIASILYQRGTISIGAITSFLFYMILLLVNFGMVASVFGNVMDWMPRLRLRRGKPVVFGFVLGRGET